MTLYLLVSQLRHRRSHLHCIFQVLRGITGSDLQTHLNIVGRVSDADGLIDCRGDELTTHAADSRHTQHNLYQTNQLLPARVWARACVARHWTVSLYRRRIVTCAAAVQCCCLDIHVDLKRTPICLSKSQLLGCCCQNLGLFVWRNYIIWAERCVDDGDWCERLRVNQQLHRMCALITHRYVYVSKAFDGTISVVIKMKWRRYCAVDWQLLRDGDTCPLTCDTRTDKSRVSLYIYVAKRLPAKLKRRL